MRRALTWPLVRSFHEGFIPLEGRHGGQSGDISPRPRSGRLGSEPSRGEKTHRASEGVTLRNARCAEGWGVSECPAVRCGLVATHREEAAPQNPQDPFAREPAAAKAAFATNRVTTKFATSTSVFMSQPPPLFVHCGSHACTTKMREECIA